MKILFLVVALIVICGVLSGCQAALDMSGKFTTFKRTSIGDKDREDNSTSQNAIEDPILGPDDVNARDLILNELNRSPNDRAKMLQLLDFYMENKQYKDAMILINNNSELMKKNAFAQRMLGQLYFLQGDIARAKDAYSSSIHLNSTSLKPYVQLAYLNMQENDMKEAEENLLIAKGIAPANKQMLIAWGNFERKRNDLEKALNYFNSVIENEIEVDRENSHAYVGISTIYRLKQDYGSAEQAVIRAIELHPKNEWAYFERGNIYRAQEKFDEARKQYDHALALNPYLVTTIPKVP